MASLEKILAAHKSSFYPVIQLNENDKLLRMDFSADNKELTDEVIADTKLLGNYVSQILKSKHAKFGIGGYGEDRIFYKRSRLFDSSDKPRSIHLGIDIWGPAGTEVYAPLGGMVHSFAFNNNFGDYGATIIVQHQLQTLQFHTLYGHVSLADLDGLQEGQYVTRGQVIAHFGKPEENGNWPPHLHFQVIDDIQLKEGDYPGVCTIEEKDWYLNNCPDADLILNVMKYTTD